MPSSFQWPVTIYYEDTDAGGVVYHANYIKFFERARTEMLRAKGISQQALLEQNIGFVVSHLEITYKQGARLDDQLIINTNIEQFKKASMLFKQQLVTQDNVVLCESLVTVACINSLKMKPQAIPTSIISELSRES